MEHEFIQWLKQNHADVSGTDLIQMGIGDDAAVMGPTDQSIVLASDMIAEGTHFRIPEDSLRMVGRKALAVNLSDLAAMGARPLACLLNLQLPRTFEVDQAKEIFAGVKQLADQHRVTILGGDTNRWDGKLVVGVTAIGQRPPVLGWDLNGSRSGDTILVSGTFGGSILGEHLSFDPRCDLALELAEKFEIHAATDVSDALSTDLENMTGDGIGFVIQTELIPISPAATELSRTSGKPEVEHGLHDGEDFELIVVTSPDVANQILNDSSLSAPMTAIGRVVDQPGLWQEDSAGGRTPLVAKGYEH